MFEEGRLHHHREEEKKRSLYYVRASGGPKEWNKSPRPSRRVARV